MQLDLLSYAPPEELIPPAQTFSIGDSVCIVSVGHPLPELLIGRCGTITRIITPSIVQVESVGVIWTLETTNLERVGGFRHPIEPPKLPPGLRRWHEAGLRYFDLVEARFADKPQFASLARQAERECDRLRQILNLKPDWEDF